MRSYEDAVAYLSVTPEPVEVAGMIQLCRDDGFVLAEDDAGAYARHTYAGTRLTLTNAAEVSPQPKPPPEPQATRAETLAAVSFARMMLPAVQSSMSANDTITVAALYDEWAEGVYQVGDIRLAAYEDSSIRYIVRAWANTGEYWEMYYAILEGARDAFARHGVEMTYNHLNVHILEQ